MRRKFTKRWNQNLSLLGLKQKDKHILNCLITEKLYQTLKAEAVKEERSIAFIVFNVLRDHFERRRKK